MLPGAISMPVSVLWAIVWTRYLRVFLHKDRSREPVDRRHDVSSGDESKASRGKLEKVCVRVCVCVRRDSLIGVPQSKA